MTNIVEQLPRNNVLPSRVGEGVNPTGVGQPHDRDPTQVQAQVTRLTYLGGGVLVPSDILIGNTEQNNEPTLPLKAIEISSDGLLRKLTRNIAETILPQ